MLKIKLNKDILFYEDPTIEVPFDSPRVLYRKDTEFEFNEVYKDRLEPHGTIFTDVLEQPKKKRTPRKKVDVNKEV